MSDTEKATTLKAQQEVVKAAMLTSHERKSGLGSLGEVVSHNLAWDAVLALNTEGLGYVAGFAAGRAAALEEAEKVANRIAREYGVLLFSGQMAPDAIVMQVAQEIAALRSTGTEGDTE